MSQYKVELLISVVGVVLLVIGLMFGERIHATISRGASNATISRGGAMSIIISPKGTLSKITLRGVASHAIEEGTLLVVFKDGCTRNYPLVHIWYFQSHVESYMEAIDAIDD